MEDHSILESIRNHVFPEPYRCRGSRLEGMHPASRSYQPGHVQGGITNVGPYVEARHSRFDEALESCVERAIVRPERQDLPIDQIKRTELHPESEACRDPSRVGAIEARLREQAINAVWAKTPERPPCEARRKEGLSSQILGNGHDHTTG